MLHIHGQCLVLGFSWDLWEIKNQLKRKNRARQQPYPTSVLQTATREQNTLTCVASVPDT